jgi:hypothetical protein
MFSSMTPASRLYPHVADHSGADQGRGGRIINIGSVDSFYSSMIGLARRPRCFQRQGLMFTRNFAVELALPV